jgi:hypothetical protein
MAKYVVPINFWVTVEADSSLDAFNKVYTAVDCDAFEDELTNAGFTNVNHIHEEPEEEKD